VIGSDWLIYDWETSKKGVFWPKSESHTFLWIQYTLYSKRSVYASPYIQELVILMYSSLVTTMRWQNWLLIS